MFKVSAGEGLLTPLVGSEHDVVISHGAYVNASLRGKGIGTALHRERIHMARANNQSLMLAIVNEENEAEIRIMDKFGWTMVKRFESNCSCHWLRLYIRETNLNTGMN